VSERPCTTVSVISTASRSPVLTRGGICVPPTVIYLPYRVSDSTLTAVGRSQLLDRCPGTHSRILSGIQRVAQTVFGVYLKRTCSRVTSASSALAVLNDYALYKSTHSLATHIALVRHRGTLSHAPGALPWYSYSARRPRAREVEVACRTHMFRRLMHACATASL